MGQHGWEDDAASIEIRRDQVPSLILGDDDNGAPWVACLDRVEPEALREIADNRALRIALALLDQARATVRAALDMPEGE